MIFTVNKSPYESNNLASCLATADGETPVLLYENGVYGAMAGTSKESLVKEALSKHKVYALGPDLKARAIEVVIEGVEVIDYDGFVELAEQHNMTPWL